MKRAIWGVSAGLVLVVLAAACVTILKTRAVLRAATARVARARTVAYSEIAWRGGTQSMFEPVAMPDGYSAGAVFAGRLYLGGMGGMEALGGQPLRLEPGRDLPASPIVALAAGRLRADGQAYLMAATRDAGLLLIRADAGAPVRQVLPETAGARPMTALLALRSGELLIGTDGAGVLRFDGRTLEPFQPALSGLAVTALAGDEAEVWVGTRDRGVLRWHAGETDRSDQTSGLPDDDVQDLVVDPSGVYVGTPLGVAVFRGGRPAGVLARDVFARRLAVQDGQLLIGTVDQGIVAVGLETGPRERRPIRVGTVPNAYNEAFFVRAEGRLLALSGGVLREMDAGGGWSVAESAGKPGLLTDRDVSALTVASDGRLWVGYFDRGLDVLDTRTQAVTHVEDERVFCVNRMVADAGRGTMDVATANGLVLFDPAQARPRVRQVLGRRDGLISDQVTDVAFTRGGMTAATPAGLTMFTSSGPRSLYSFEGLANSHVYALAGTPDSDRLLAGTLGGISVLEDGGVTRNVTLRNSGLKRNWITAIVSVPDGTGRPRWLVGTYGGGVEALSADGQVTEMAGSPRDAVINPNAMLATARHVLVGTLSSGLLVMDRATERWATVTAGLPSLHVTAFAEREGVVYVGTDNGLVRVAEARLP